MINDNTPPPKTLVDGLVQEADHLAQAADVADRPRRARTLRRLARMARETEQVLRKARRRSV